VPMSRQGFRDLDDSTSTMSTSGMTSNHPG
jgi:hypothetical protein